MKSLLQEGSSVLKAVEAAWVKVGKPEEFSIKILKNEEQKFLGITWTNSVVVSIAYDFPINHEKRNNYNRQTFRNDSKKKINHNDILEKVTRDTERLQAETNCFSDSVQEKQKNIRPREENPKKCEVPVKKQSLSPEKKEIKNLNSSTKSQDNKNEIVQKVEKQVAQIKNNSKQNSSGEEGAGDEVIRERWTEPMIDAVMVFLKDIFRIMEIEVAFVHKVDKLQLRIAFEKTLCDNKDQEYKIYTSLAFLMLQMIKREFKKKCKGYRVVFGLQEQEVENK